MEDIYLQNAARTAIRSLFIKKYPNGKLFFANNCIVVTDSDNVIVDSTNIENLIRKIE